MSHAQEQYEVIPGIMTAIDETSRHPLYGGSEIGKGAPDRPCKPASADYQSKKEPVTPRPLDRPLAYDYRLRTGFRMMGDY